MKQAIRAFDDVEAPLPRLADLLAGNEILLMRPLVEIISREISRQRGKPVQADEIAGWTERTTVEDNDLGVDSLARLELVASVNQAFQLHRTGVEDYLLLHRSLGDWCRIISEGFRQLPPGEREEIAFVTSGSTGVSKMIVHDVADLIAEAIGHAQLFAGTSRVLAAVPSNHIYGFLFTVLLPRIHSWSVLDLTRRAPGALARESTGW